MALTTVAISDHPNPVCDDGGANGGGRDGISGDGGIGSSGSGTGCCTGLGLGLGLGLTSAAGATAVNTRTLTSDKTAIESADTHNNNGNSNGNSNGNGNNNDSSSSVVGGTHIPLLTASTLARGNTTYPPQPPHAPHHIAGASTARNTTAAGKASQCNINTPF